MSTASLAQDCKRRLAINERGSVVLAVNPVRYKAVSEIRCIGILWHAQNRFFSPIHKQLEHTVLNRERGLSR